MNEKMKKTIVVVIGVIMVTSIVFAYDRPINKNDYDKPISIIDRVKNFFGYDQPVQKKIVIDEPVIINEESQVEVIEIEEEIEFVEVCEGEICNAPLKNQMVVEEIKV